jgi:hypothetical protein
MARLAEDLDPTLPPAKRHEYLRRRLTGVEKDPFAIEVSRLLLTLSDYPNHNSWDLHCDDVFKWPGWDSALGNSDVVLANPPYEKFSASEKKACGATKANPPAEFLRRLMLRPPAMLGLVLPQSFLSSPFFRDANRQIARHYEEVQIVELPKLFRYADNETIALMAHGRRDTGKQVIIRYSEVTSSGLDAFLNDFVVSDSREKTIDLGDSLDSFSMRLPFPNSIFDSFREYPVLGEVAQIRPGVQWVARTDGKTRSEDRADVASDRPKEGFMMGCEKMKGNLSQFQIQRTRYLSMREEHQDPSTRAHLHSWSQPKIVCNAARFERTSPWRLAAFADTQGLAFTKRFFAIWPTREISEYAIAAILNSPVGNAFIVQHDLGRDNHTATLAQLPLPPLSSLLKGGLIDRRAREIQNLFADDNLLEHLQAGKRREALLRMDAAVLDAYGLSAEAQRELLDLFEGETRQVGFEFERYFPPHFRNAITLSDFVAIEYDWQATNERRRSLIDLNLDNDSLPPAEQAELRHLQHLADLVIRLKDPYPLGELDGMIGKLKAEGKWKQ